MTDQRCDRCNGLKHILLDGKWVQCPCLVKAQRRREMIKARIPSYMLDLTWEEWESQHKRCHRILGQIQAWKNRVISRKAVRFACVAGGSGSGKTTLAYLIIRDCVQAGMTASVFGLSELIQDRFADVPELMDRSLSVDVLCMRLGMEEDHKWRSSMLEKIHFGRKAENKPTFYTTRLQAAEFERVYGSVLGKSFWTAKLDVLVWDLQVGRLVVP